MNKSPDIDKIAPALLAAQKQIKAVAKTGVNTFFNKERGGSKYAPLDDVLSACKEAMNENGITILQGGEISDGDILHLTTTLLHNSGQWIESTLSMRPTKADPQGIGSCVTYARRYSLASICGVVSDDDDDGNTASQPVKAAKAKAETTAEAPAFDERTALMGRIAVSKARKGARELPPEVWNSLLTKAFDTADRAEIANMTPTSIKAGIDKLNALIDEIEGV